MTSRSELVPPRVVNRRRSAFDVYIGRPGKWGNPFRASACGSRERAVSLYREYALSTPSLLAALPELTGQRLGCWCSPKRCHGDVLVTLWYEHVYLKGA